MSVLHLIRHGQASFGAEDYDVLSPTGIAQARVLGEHLAGAPRVDAIYSGPRRRQRETAEHLRAAASSAGRELPPPTVIDDLDEYAAFEIVKYAAPLLLERDPAIRGLSPGEVFAEIVRRWLGGELECGPHETFAAFAARVVRGLQSIMAAEGRGRSALVVTSGGPISVAVQAALELPSRALLKLQMVTFNASISEFKFTGDRLSMISFNGVGHLVGRAPLTLR